MDSRLRGNDTENFQIFATSLMWSPRSNNRNKRSSFNELSLQYTPLRAELQPTPARWRYHFRK